MPFDSEKAFEQHIRGVIKSRILPRDTNLVLFESKKAVDILLCRNGEIPALYFIEIKYHKNCHGRLAFGHSEGGGFQPEIIQRQPIYFERNMRWILGAEDKEGYYVVDNTTLRTKYLSGGSVAPKYNNIKTKLFSDEQALTESELTDYLIDWLVNNPVRL